MAKVEITEDEYLALTSLGKLTSALNSLRGIMLPDSMKEIDLLINNGTVRLYDAEESMRKLISCKSEFESTEL